VTATYFRATIRRRTVMRLQLFVPRKRGVVPAGSGVQRICAAEQPAAPSAAMTERRIARGPARP